MTFESLVLMTMAEEHLANSRPGSSGSVHSETDLKTQMANWKPLKVKFSGLLLVRQFTKPECWPLIGRGLSRDPALSL